MQHDNKPSPVFSSLSKESLQILTAFPEIIESLFPEAKKHRHALKHEIRSLFHEFTNDRTNRAVDYMANPKKRIAYISYYLWWNLLRLVKLFSDSDIEIEKTAADFGSGPLTVVCAMWIAKPALRNKAIQWYCCDISGKALAAGEDIFLALTAYTARHSVHPQKEWRITKIKGNFGLPLKEKVSFVSAANMFNELYKKKRTQRYTQHIFENLKKYLNRSGSIFIIEPGVPPAAELLTSLRALFLREHFSIVAPCTHANTCPLSMHARSTGAAIKNKWCHFAFTTEDAPRNLLKFSKEVQLEKDRAGLSFLFVRMQEKTKQASRFARICSDTIRLPNNTVGRYACCEQGFILLSEEQRGIVSNSSFGGVLPLPPFSAKKLLRDKKSGAHILSFDKHAKADRKK